jgi:NAD(P)-dependent dehydrogenase (short-subunit alcohol dehydrogenase family)
MLFAVGASNHWRNEGITANALNPGAIPTNLQRHRNDKKPLEQGAATSVLLATSPLIEGIGGRYFVDCNEAELVPSRTPDYSGAAHYALDADNAERLWEVSLRMVA